MLTKSVIFGILVPFLGTTLGSMMVVFMKDKMHDKVQKSLQGFASGVMVAAAIWSLLIPSMQIAKDNGMENSVFPAVIGFWLGIGFLLLIDSLVPHIHLYADKAEGLSNHHLRKTSMMVLAVTIHNIPEGMAVGVVFAGLAAKNPELSIGAAMALSIGIAIQNFPEGAIISMPLRAEGMSKTKAFLMGTLSGIVEPIGTILTILAAGAVTLGLPYFLSFAAGAMMYVVVEELIPEMSSGEHSNAGTICFGIGFSLMMVLDVLLG